MSQNTLFMFHQPLLLFYGIVMTFLPASLKYVYNFLEGKSVWKFDIATSHARTSPTHSTLRDASKGLPKEIASGFPRLERC